MKTRIVSRMVALLSLFAVVSPNFVPDAIGQEELSEAVPAEDLDSLDKFDATENPKAPDTRG